MYSDIFSTLCLLGNFACFFCGLLNFFKINFFKIFFQEYIRVSNILLSLIWIQTVCKGYHRHRDKYVTCWVIFFKSTFL